jgi:dihydrofolate synthase/folylpolyglutamate synthase
VGYFSEFVSIVNENQWVLSYIEFLTIFTFWLFARLQLNYMVIEVGLGGRLDPTNTMTGRATVRVITDIGLDHTEILGETLPAIAREKSGIIHDDDTVVMHQQDAAVMDVVREAVEGRAAVLRVVTTDSLTAPLPMFQQRNWTLAKAAVAARLELDGVDPLSRSQAEVTLSLMIPGRFEIRMHQGVTVVLDAAHNEQKIAALTESVRAAYPATLAYYVVALGENKMNQAEAIIAHIERDADVTVTRFTTQAVRGEIAPEALAEFGSKVRSIEDPYDAFGVALQDARDHSGIVVVTGSFYLVDGIRERLTAAEKNNLL